MSSLNELPADALKLARESAAVLIDRKAYLPPGGLLLMLLSKFRDDIAEYLGGDTAEAKKDKPKPLPRREREHHSLDELTSVELDTVAGAGGILLQDRFKAIMDNPELPRQLAAFSDDLIEQKIERAQIQASLAS
jgi:hypothetical protein